MTISHEFRTPLGTAIMFLESLLEEPLPEHVKKVIKMVIAQLNLLLSLVNGVLDLKAIAKS